MPYIGHAPTNAGTFYVIDDLTMSSSTTYTLQVGGVSVTPRADNLLITLDGVVQHATDAYTVSGSTLTFASAPGSGVDFYGIIMGQSASFGQGSIGADELSVTGDGTSNQFLSSDADGTMTWKDGALSTMSATGDIIYRNASGVVAKLSIGSTGQLLTVASGLPSWATDSEPYLPLAGGTMSGAINLGSQNVTNGGTITGTFVGGITGNVTGNASGTALTVTQAAQTAITSVGTLGILNVTGAQSGDFLVKLTSSNAYGLYVKTVGTTTSHDLLKLDDNTGTVFKVMATGETTIGGTVTIDDNSSLVDILVLDGTNAPSIKFITPQDDWRIGSHLVGSGHDLSIQNVTLTKNVFTCVNDTVGLGGHGSSNGTDPTGFGLIVDGTTATFAGTITNAPSTDGAYAMFVNQQHATGWGLRIAGGADSSDNLINAQNGSGTEKFVVKSDGSATFGGAIKQGSSAYLCKTHTTSGDDPATTIVTFTVTINNHSSWFPVIFKVLASGTIANLSGIGHYSGYTRGYSYGGGFNSFSTYGEDKSSDMSVTLSGSSNVATVSVIYDVTGAYWDATARGVVASLEVLSYGGVVSIT